MSVNKFGRMSSHPFIRHRQGSSDYFDVNHSKIINLQSPVANFDAANKLFVEETFKNLHAATQKILLQHEEKISNKLDDFSKRVDEQILNLTEATQPPVDPVSNVYLWEFFAQEMKFEKNKLRNILTEYITRSRTISTAEGKHSDKVDDLLNYDTLLEILEEW